MKQILKQFKSTVIRMIPDTIYIKMMYRKKIGKKLNLKKPKTFNEKLQWLKIYDRNPFYTTIVDKVSAKEYAAKVIGKKYIVPTYGVYDNFNEINFNDLPNSFVIKCNHYGGNHGVYVVDKKGNMDIALIKNGIEEVLKKNLYYYGREWPYKNIKPKIIVEENLSLNGVINDYKFQTFNGKVAFCFVCTDRENTPKFTFFDRNKKIINVKQCNCDNDPQNATLPKNYDLMFSLAEKLASDFIEVRVDFYEVDNRVFFGELTLYDSSGFGKFEPDEWDLKFGNMLDLSSIEK